MARPAYTRAVPHPASGRHRTALFQPAGPRAPGRHVRLRRLRASPAARRRHGRRPQLRHGPHFGALCALRRPPRPRVRRRAAANRAALLHERRGNAVRAVGIAGRPDQEPVMKKTRNSAPPAAPGRRTACLRLAGAGLLAMAGWLAIQPAGRAADAVFEIPPPARDVPAAGGMATAVLAGGCFWGVQAVFQHVEGVREALSGYAGGSAATADYETVSGGRSGHAEAVRITYDPARVSYGKLLQIYFSVVHDPTQRNRQGPDVGPQYRSAI